MSYQPQSNNPYGQPGWNVGGGQGGTPVYADPEVGMPKNELGFNDQTIRSAFVRKVFTLVAIMLGVVTLMSAVPHFYTTETMEHGKMTTHYPIRDFIQRNIALYIIALVVFFVVYMVLICCDGVRRTHPTNLICTGVLTVAIGFMTATITSFYTLDSVVLALAVTTLSCVGIVVFAMTTKRDITSLMGFMFIATLCLMLFGFFAIFWTMIFHTRALYMVYCALGTLLFMVYLAIDIQMIMGGRKYEISPEEHIFAAIMLFLDIVQIFWFILSLIGDRS